MLCVVLNLLLIALPTVWMRINPGNYAEWIAAAFLVGLYAVFVVTGTTLIFERHVFYELVNRLIGINSNRRKVSV
jgi:hypothetical protein